MSRTAGYGGRAVALAIGFAVLVSLGGCWLLFPGGATGLPVARITAHPLSGASPLAVTLDGTASTDPDGSIVGYLWDFDDGRTSQAATVTHTFTAVDRRASYLITLTVTDNSGNTATAQQTIEVRPPEPDDGDDDGDGDNGDGNGDGVSPTARITASRLIGMSPLAITFDADGSTPGSGSITTYRWDLGDGDTAEGSLYTHTFQPPQTTRYTVTLFVWNDADLMDTEQIEIVAMVPEPGATVAPTADVTIEEKVLLFDSNQNENNLPTLYGVRFDGRGSFADAGHQIQYYYWEFGDGEVLLETTDAKVDHTYELRGLTYTYRAELTVYDDQGLEDSILVNVTLEEP
jgi:PKD repeat protein